jgi:uncharacterized membrane protein
MADVDLQQLSLFIGALLPLIISMLNRVDWSSRQKSLVAFTLCVGGAVVTTGVVGDFSSSDPVESFAIVFGAAKVSYEALWKPTGVSPKIETSVHA